MNEQKNDRLNDKGHATPSEAKLRAILETAVEGIITIDRFGQIDK